MIEDNYVKYLFTFLWFWKYVWNNLQAAAVHPEINNAILNQGVTQVFVFKHAFRSLVDNNLFNNTAQLHLQISNQTAYIKLYNMTVPYTSYINSRVCL